MTKLPKTPKWRKNVTKSFCKALLSGGRVQSVNYALVILKIPDAFGLSKNNQKRTIIKLKLAKVKGSSLFLLYSLAQSPTKSDELSSFAFSLGAGIVVREKRLGVP